MQNLRTILTCSLLTLGLTFTLEAQMSSPQHGIDRPGQNLRNFKATGWQECSNSCGSQKDCNAYTFINQTQTCWLKSSAPVSRQGIGMVSGIRIMGSIERGVDRLAPNLRKGFSTTDALGCQRACQLDAKCKAWAWVKPSQGGDDACWLKSEAGAASRNNCCVSGVRLVADSERTQPAPQGSKTSGGTNVVVKTREPKEPDTKGKKNSDLQPKEDQGVASDLTFQKEPSSLIGLTSAVDADALAKTLSCRDRASKLILIGNSSTEVLKDDCVTGWSDFPTVEHEFYTFYNNLLADCSSSLPLATKLSLSAIQNRIKEAAAICEIAIRCHEAVDAYADVGARLEAVLNGGCVDPDYWALQWPTNSLFADAYDACFDISAPNLYLSVKDQLSSAALQVSHAVECSKPQYNATRCRLVKVETFTRSKKFAMWRKTILVESRTYECPSETDVAMCMYIHPPTVSVDKADYIIHAHKDISVINNICILEGG